MCRYDVFCVRKYCIKLAESVKLGYEIGRKEHEIRRKEQVGMYLRNQNIRDKAFDDQYKKRAEYEKIHGHIKGTVKFDIRRVRNQSRKLYSLLSS